jgi:8-oxo-dGTP pyrophosphatase MutT (NUDIX family)
VFSQNEGIVYLAFVHDIWGYWTIAKGKVDTGESPEEACLREIQEEIGILPRIVAHLGDNIYESRSTSAVPVKNHINYFLLESDYTELHLETTGGLDDVRWVPLGKVDKLRMYEDIAQMLTKAIPLIMQRYQDN